VKVLHVQKASGIGGLGGHPLVLLPALAARGIDTGIAVLESESGHRFTEELQRRGVRAVPFRAGRDANPALVARLTKWIRAEQPDVVHTHLIHADMHGLIAARAARIPAVSSMHGTPAFYRRQPYHTIGRAAGRLARRRIAISECVAGFLRELHLAPPDRIRVVHYGLDATTWAPDEEARRRTRLRYGVPDDAVVLGIAARLIPGKGHDELVEAVGRAERDGAPVRLLVAGEGPRRSALEALAASSARPGVVSFTGFVDDVRAFMNGCDVVAFPTLPELGEGFGLAALEAMAVGKPVLATAVGSLPEVVADGETGVVVPPGSIDALYAALSGLVQDPRRREAMGAAGRERAIQLFSVDLMTKRICAVYEEAAAS